MSKLITRLAAVLLITMVNFTSLAPFLSAPESIFAQDNSCGGSSSIASNSEPSRAQYKSRVGAVGMTQAAKFLANMSEVTGAYYDANLDRIVFIGKTNTTLPKFDRDDLAVAIRAIMFKGQHPSVSLVFSPTDPTKMNVIYGGGIKNTKFADVYLKADYATKQYDMGYDSNGNKIISNVPGYQSITDRYFQNPFYDSYIDSISSDSITIGVSSKNVTLTRNDQANAFVFNNSEMQVTVTPDSPLNDPLFNQVANAYADHFTQNFDLFAQELPELASFKQLSKMVSVVKWINDSGIATDFYWARDYTPRFVSTPSTVNKIVTPPQIGPQHQGFADTNVPNTYVPDTLGQANDLKSASQTVPTTKEDVRWTFTKDGTQYESVAVSADAFRSLGSYNTSVTDMSFPATGDLDLTFERVYSSFSGGQYGVGRGWNIYPASLYDNNPSFPAKTLPCTNGEYPKSLALVSQAGGFESFTINDCNIGYVADDPVYHSKIARNADGSYTAILKDQTKLNFNTDFKLTSIKDKNDNPINYNYDASGQLTNISDGKGHQITINYGPDNLIHSITDWSGRVVEYSYDEDGNLISSKDPNGNTTNFTYDANFKLTSIKDRNGQVILTNTYTDEAKLQTQKDAANITSTHTYDKVNRVITTVDNNNKAQISKYDPKARILEYTDPMLFKLIYTYGIEYAPLTIKDKRGNTIANAYDANGNLTSTTFPDTKKVNYQYDSFNRLTKILDGRYGITTKDTTNTYDVKGNLTQSNEAGKITKLTYDAEGEPLTLTDALNHITSWTRDSFGNQLTQKDALLNVSSFEYDAIARLKKMTDADLKVTSFTYDNNSNLLTRQDAAGTTTNIYDKEGRLTKITLPNSSVHEFTYNNLGTLTSVKDPALSVTNYGYDSYQNLTTQTDALNNITTNIYDNLNRQAQSKTPLGKVSKWEYDANGNITKRIDPANQATAFTYDAFNRLTKKTLPDGKIVTYNYDNRGNLVSMVDPLGTSNFTYNNFDERTKETNPYGSALNYEYNPTGTLKKVTYPDGKAVNYIYDNSDRLIEVKDWNLKSTKYTYLKNDLVATRTYPNAVVTTYNYDGANRLSSMVHKKGTTVLAQYIYERDSVGNITKVTESGSFISTPSVVNQFPNPTPIPLPIAVANGPDLVITGLRLDPAPVGGYTTTAQYPTLYIKVKNQGTQAVNSLVVFTSNLDLEGLPTYITPTVYFDNITVDLTPGQEKEYPLNQEISRRVGAHSIWAMVDKKNFVAETNENNNSFGPLNFNVVAPGATPAPTPTPVPTPTATPTPTPSATPTPTPTPPSSAPDLIVSSVTLSKTNPAVGENISITANIKNQSSVGTGSITTRVGFYYDRPTPPTTTTTYDDTETIFSGLTANQTKTVTESLIDFSTPGQHTIWVLADREGAVSESNENNNVYGPITITVGAQANAGSSIFKFLGGLFNGLVSEISAQAAPLISAFTYDVLGRLTNAVYPNQGNYSYIYDKVGNITKKTENGGESNYYYDEDDKLKQMYNALYFFDKNGNITRKSQGFIEDEIFTFDSENRLIRKINKNELAYSYKYDGLGNKVESYFEELGDPNIATRFVHNTTTGEVSKLMAITGGASPTYVSNHYIHGLGPISEGDTGSSWRRYYLEDGVGNIRFITNSSGNRSAYMDYGPHGDLWRSFSEDKSTFLFKGEPTEGQLYFMRARYYDQETGRFISRDPVKGLLTNPQSQNPYAYALNNPNSYSDPSGLDIYGLCVNAAVAFPVYGTCSVCAIYSTDEKKVSASATLGGGGSTGFLVAVGPQGIHSTAKSFKEFEGQDVFGGSSIGEVLGWGVDFSADPNNPNNNTFSTGPNLGVRLGLPFPPVEGHGGSTYTWVLP